jgi:hypothetical protein
MKKIISRVRKPVRRSGAETYLLITLLAFAFSVGATRLFLEITGYPQLGNSELHIAHVLWGGILLFVASLLPLIFANRWAYLWSAVLSGLGVGLFIDEVGKFITQSNDYFYPAAAPIIYAFFLLTVLLYIQVRRPPIRDPRVELYYVLDLLEEVLDHDLDPKERNDLLDRLRYIAANTQHPNLANLARGLLDFLKKEDLQLAPTTPGYLERLLGRFRTFESRWLTRTRLRAGLIGGLAALGLVSLNKLIQILRATLSPSRLEQMVSEMVALGRVASASGLGWFSARLALEGAVGLLLIIATSLFLVGRERRGVGIGYLSLLLSITTVNLLIFFFDQFSTIITAGVQFSLLIVLLYYRRRFLEQETMDP